MCTNVYCYAALMLFYLGHCYFTVVHCFLQLKDCSCAVVFLGAAILNKMNCAVVSIVTPTLNRLVRCNISGLE